MALIKDAMQAITCGCIIAYSLIGQIWLGQIENELERINTNLETLIRAKPCL